MCLRNITHLTLPNDKIVDQSKLKAYVDDNICMAQKIEICLGRVENIVGKGYQHFLLLVPCFQNASFSGS